MKPAEISHNRIYIVISVLCAVGLILVGQLVRWQVIEHPRLKKMAEDEYQNELIIPPRRGEIRDSYGHLLAADMVEYDLSVSPNIVADPAALAVRLADLLDKPRDELFEILASDVEWTPLAQNISQEQAEKIFEWDNVGLQLDPQTRRVYPEGDAAAHLLGFVNGNGEGFYGIEGYYNNLLRGKAGVQAGERSPFGEMIPLGTNHFVPPVSGGILYLTIDRTIQYMIEQELERAVVSYGAQRGSVVVLNPKTGGVLGMANYPAYDPNNYNDSDEELFFDTIVSKQYEPGSVFKIITMAAGLDSGVVRPESIIYDAGYMEVGGQVIYNWDRQGHGNVDMTTVLAKSLNVGVAQIATSMGKDRFYNYVRRFGFGRLTEIDLGSEGPGSLKTPQDANWYASDLGANSFGQGIAVTPIQIASAVAAIANEGLLMKPYVVDRVVQGEQEIQVKPSVVRRAVSTHTAHTLTNMLVAALEQAGSEAVLDDYRIAGKTGTAEIPVAGGYHPTLTLASFVGYFPPDNPEVLVLVIIDRPTSSRWGSKTAAPTFKRIAEQLVIILDIPPDNVRNLTMVNE